MKLRPYQTDCHKAVFKALREYDSTLMVLATGVGKTVILAHIASDWTDRRVMVIAHREELIRQGAEKIEAVSGNRPGIEMGAESVDECSFAKPKIVVASIQTLSRARRLSRFKPEEFGLLIVDEAHHATARSYREVFDHFPGAKRLGPTATPKRADGLAMGMVFDSVAYEYGIEAAVDDGYLVPIRQQVVHVEDLDFSKARSTAGDFNEGDLERILTQEKMLHRIASPSIKEIGNRPALVFCVTVAHAKKLTEILNRYKPECAEWLSGETPREDRALIIQQFKAGKIQVLCSCGLFLEGFDAPATAAIIMARPTKSLSLYTQILGRGTRPLTGVIDGLDTAAQRLAAIRSSGKQDVLALDFVGNAGRHKIITAADVLGGRWADPVREYHHKTLEEEGGAVLLDEGMERARAELALEMEQAEILSRIKAQATYRTVDESPFAMGAAPRREESRYEEPATKNQVWKMISLGCSPEFARSCSKRKAQGVIGTMLRRQGQSA